jgi:hypothetical protein
MKSSVMLSGRRHSTSPVVLMVALLCISSLSVYSGGANASDLQRSTDRAALRAKAELCIALNRGVASAELKEKFFAFYEGKIVSAGVLHPETFSIGQIGPLPSFKVTQILGPNEMLASIDSSVFKLRNVSTADMADGQRIRLTDFFVVRTTDTYDTVTGGTNTVYVLELAKRNMPEVKPTRVYPWYNRKDEVVITGEFKTIDGPNAVFLANGQEASERLTKFTPGDRALMRILLDRYPQEKPPETPENKPVEKAPALPVGID